MRTVQDLMVMQALPLEQKIGLTRLRVRDWINEYYEDGVYISFSGGKDSTVLLDLVRNEFGYKDVPAVFVDVPTQYPELREFAKTFDNVEIIRPKISFMEVCEKYGFPMISKEVSGAVYEGRRYVEKVRQLNGDKSDEVIKGYYSFADLTGIPRRQGAQHGEQYNNLKVGIIPEELTGRDYYEYGKNFISPTVRTKSLFGEVIHKEKGIITKEYSKRYDKSKYSFFLTAPFDISDQCCKVMKKTPLHTYSRRTGRIAMTAQMAEESELKKSQWIKHGCNGFDMKSPISNPLSFWTEQDILQYIKEKNLPLCSVYGDVVEDYEAMGQIEGQISLVEPKKVYKTTGCKRTGCMLCGFGCHMEKKSRFLELKQTHPKMYNMLDVCKNNGVTFREAIEWTNEHGNLDIKL